MSSSAQDSNISNIFGAFGSLLGYVGAEAITSTPFERLLWPQRSWSDFNVSQIPWLALLSPMGGPMYKAALDVFDIAYNHGLLKGALQGHMLGTTFFPDLGWTYTTHESQRQQKAVRNCIWARAMTLVMIPELDQRKWACKLNCLESAVQEPRGQETVRAKFRVSHLTIATATEEDKRSALPLVIEGHKTPSLRIVLAILTSELSALAAAVGVAAAFRSPWALIWILPLILRLLSAAFALEREPLTQPVPPSSESQPVVDPEWDLEVHYPQSEANLLLLTGPESLLFQFTRHYGHPKRDRFREIIQLMIVVTLACLFPAELVCSAIWMPVDIQYVWLSYQLYVVLYVLKQPPDKDMMPRSVGITLTFH